MDSDGLWNKSGSSPLTSKILFPPNFNLQNLLMLCSYRYISLNNKGTVYDDKSKHNSSLEDCRFFEQHCMYINDLPDVLDGCCVHMYAADVLRKILYLVRAALTLNCIELTVGLRQRDYVLIP